MVYDRLELSGGYESTHGLFAVAIGFLSRPGFSAWKEGRYELSDGAFVSLQSYDTKPIAEGLFESHRQFIDIQTVLEGEEWIYVSGAEALTLTRPYDAEEDCAFYRGGAESSRLLMRPGLFLLLFPHDAHMPSIAIESPRRVRKAVAKLPIRDRQG